MNGGWSKPVGGGGAVLPSRELNEHTWMQRALKAEALAAQLQAMLDAGEKTAYRGDAPGDI